jgi:hypothetical protein
MVVAYPKELSKLSLVLRGRIIQHGGDPGWIWRHALLISHMAEEGYSCLEKPTFFQINCETGPRQFFKDYLHM